MLLVPLLLACSKEPSPPPEPPLDPSLLRALDPARMKAHVDVLADDATGGRIPGSPGAAAARDYLLGELEELGLEHYGSAGGFAWEYPNTPEPDFYMRDAGGQVVPQATLTGTNLIAALPGRDPARAHEVMVVMARYDHLGVDAGGDPFNGAFDNAAAVAMNLEIARVLVEAGTPFDRTVVFLFTDDEEFGLDGADAWIRDPTVDPADVVFGVSTDPLGRAMLPDYAPIVLIGLERAPAFEAIWREAARFVEAPIHFVNRDVVPIFSSDQDPFYDQQTAAVWFTNIGFTWYHTVDDAPETIDYRILLRDAELLLNALAIGGNTDARFPYEGPVEPGAQAARDAKALIAGVKGSSYPSASDRSQADFLMEQLDLVIEADDASVLGNSEALYTAGLYYLLFDLPGKYPGTVPPPWPEGR